MTAKRQNARPTIAYLASEAVVGPTPMSLWSGVEAGAREQDLNLIAFPGGILRYTQHGQANIVYDLITPETFAGLVTWAVALQHQGSALEDLSDEEVLALHTRYHPLPIVTLSQAVPGYPVARVESGQGIRDAIAHLTEVHGYRRIAFIRGPEAHSLAQARYHAYLDALADYGFGVNGDLITPPGWFSVEHGTQAVDLFLDQRGLRPKEDVEAIVAASDLMALGAMEALQRRSVRVPEDVAIVGFNDSIEARSASPSITSVAVPFREQGIQAVDALKRMLEGESVPDETIIQSRLAIHQSCGCLDATVAQAGTFSPGAGAGISLEEAFTTRRETIVREMVQAMVIPDQPAWAESVLDGFILNLGESQPGGFPAALREVLRRAPLADRASPAWQNVLSVLQRHAVSCVDSQTALLLIGQARAMLGETTSRALAQLQFQAERRVQTLHAISSALITTFDVEKLMDALADGLPRLGIPSCYLALYEDPQPYVYPQPAPEWSRLILAYNENGHVALEPGAKRFPTHHLVPKGMLPANRRYTMVAQPLYFQDAQIGFVLFEVGPQDWSVYEVLRGEIASALQGALLLRARAKAEAERERLLIALERRSVQLQAAAEVSSATSSMLDPNELIQRVVDLAREWFDLYYAGLFLEDETREWAVLKAGTGEAGQKMIEQGHKLKVGGESMIGWCMANKQARIALDVGAEAVRFDNLLLPETRSELALPLVTRGETIGALTIQSTQESAFSEEDIAVLQTMADQLANAITNAQLYDKAQQEIVERKRVEDALARQAQMLDAELERFFFVASHHLQEPLRTVVTYSQLLQQRYEGKLDAEADEIISFSVSGATRIRTLLNDVLAFARVTTQGRSFEPTDSSAIVNSVTNNLSAVIERTGAKVTHGSLPEVVVDRGQLTQVFQQLLINTTQYRSDRPLRVHVSAKRGEDEWVFSVQDNGIGIEPRYLDRIFQIFERLHSDWEHQGTGIGLAICKKIVDRHGGRIWVESEPGKGSTFHFTIPDRGSAP
jgi:signal transduction histidine kinase/DNA-binding LacI/PurR family transcriptional regulator